MPRMMWPAVLQPAVERVAHGHHDDGLRHAVALQQRHAGGVEELVHRVGQRAAADAGEAQPAAEPGADLAEDEAVGERVERAQRRRRPPAPSRAPACGGARPRGRTSGSRPSSTRRARARRERARHQPARQPAPERRPPVDLEEHALVQLDPQLRHGGHDDRPHLRQVAAQVQHAAVVDVAALAQVHELHLALVGVPRLQHADDRLALDLEQLRELAEVELVVAVRERDALGRAGRARRVDDRGQVVGAHLLAAPRDLPGALRPRRLAEPQSARRACGRRGRRPPKPLAGGGLAVRRAVGPSMSTTARTPGSASRTSASCAGCSRITTAGSACRRMASRMSCGVSEARGTSTAPEEVDGEAADQPLRAVVADEGDELAVADAELARERQRQHARAPVELVVGERREDAVHAAAERGLVGRTSATQPANSRGSVAPAVPVVR